MASDVTGVLDEAYLRLHVTGPEFDGWLSNHGPMAAEAMSRHGHGDDVHRWLDGYMRRLEEFPRGASAIGADWQEALGDDRRIADWTNYFRDEMSGRTWREVLGTWWPRLLPGVAAAATHGVIRTGHAVRALLADGDDPAHVAELAHGLAYWAARWQPVPVGQAEHEPGPERRPERTAWPAGIAPADALSAIPRIAGQTGGIRDRLARLNAVPGWSSALDVPGLPARDDEIAAWLAGLADAAVFRYIEVGHGNPVMLVHSATAPTAILRSLPALHRDLWEQSAAAAWAAAAALTSIYAPPSADHRTAAEPAAGQDNAEEVFAMAVSHGDEHVIKFADTAVDVYARTANPAALAAAARAIELVPRGT